MSGKYARRPCRQRDPAELSGRESERTKSNRICNVRREFSSYSVAMSGSSGVAWARVVMLAGATSIVACGSTPLAMPPGSEGGSCYGNGSCNVSLTCYSNICVRVTGADAGAGQDGSQDDGVPTGGASGSSIAGKGGAGATAGAGGVAAGGTSGGSGGSASGTAGVGGGTAGG